MQANLESNDTHSKKKGKRFSPDPGGRGENTVVQLETNRRERRA